MYANIIALREMTGMVYKIYTDLIFEPFHDIEYIHTLDWAYDYIDCWTVSHVCVVI